MRRLVLVPLLLAAGAVLGGCGNKGPLVMPPDAPPPMTPAPAATAPSAASTAPAAARSG